jgi:superfamily II DNA or RNA helicase
MTFEKRRYQERIVENFEKWIETDGKLATIILPVGTGKTITTSFCLEKVVNKKILWVAHRRELIDQAYDSLKTVITWTDKIEKEIGEEKANPKSDIIVGSVQTISRNRKHFKGFIPDIIIIDEYHHQSKDNKTYQYLVKTWPNAKIIGLTATPWRFSGDDLPLGNVLLEMDIGTAISHGYLVPLKPEILKSNISLANVKTQMGDFAISELSKTINVEERNKLIISKIVDLVKSGRKGIVFAADVAHSKELCFLASKKGISTAEIYGDTPNEKRDQLVKLIRNGQIDCTFNNCCFLEGTDIPIWSFAIMARPTRSLGLYIQAIGRSARKFPGKTDAIIVDVYDKLKMKQSRITFNDMANHGDMFGERKRANNILTALLPTWKDIQGSGPAKNPSTDHIADKLINFPVFMVHQDQDRWTTDDDFFPITSWVVSNDQRLITWTEEHLIDKLIDKTTWKEMTVKPTLAAIKQIPIHVMHDSYGEGKIVDIGLGTEVKVEFTSGGWMAGQKEFVPISSLKIKHTFQELSTQQDKKKIDRVFYLCFPAAVDKGRMVEMTKSGGDLVVIKDERLTKAEAKNYIVESAKKVGILALVRGDAKWKKILASESQKKFIENLMFAGKIKFDLDIDNITKGEASAIIEQTKWQKIIIEKFGAKSKDKLLGYDSSVEDV